MNHAGERVLRSCMSAAEPCPSSLTINNWLQVEPKSLEAIQLRHRKRIDLTLKEGGSQSESYVGGLMSPLGATIESGLSRQVMAGQSSDNDAFLGGASGNGKSALGGAGTGISPAAGGR